MSIKKFLKNEMKLAAGEQIFLAAKSESSSSLISYYFRAVLGRADLAAVVQDTTAKESSFVNSLELIRQRLRLDDLTQAQILLDQLIPTNSLENYELQLERTRLFIFKGEFTKVIEGSDEVIQKEDLPLSSRMTLHQVRGLAYCNLKQFENAIQELNKAVALAQLFPKANSGFIAYTILVQTYSYQQDFEKAQKILEKIEIILEGIDSVEEWTEKKVQHLRCLSHLYRNQRLKEKTLQVLQEASILSEWLDLKVTSRLCQNDLKNFADVLSETNTVIRKKQWTYLPQHKLILCDFPKSIYRLEDSEVTARLIEILLKNPLHQDDLLREVWGLSGIEKYQAHLRTHLSKLRLKLPKGALFVKDQFVYLQ